MAAGLLGAAEATVTLRAPPPVDRPLRVERPGGAVELHDGDTLVARAERDRLELDVPMAPSVEEARAGSEAWPWAGVHPFPTCFVCGPDRHPPEALHLLLGRVDGRDVSAAPWTPDTSLAAPDGALPIELVWAALDCPTSIMAISPGRPSALGRLTARIDGPVRAGEPHVVTGWAIGHDGRKHLGGAAIHTAEGTLVGRSRGLWIELRDPSVLGAV